MLRAMLSIQSLSAFSHGSAIGKAPSPGPASPNAQIARVQGNEPVVGRDSGRAAPQTAPHPRPESPVAPSPGLPRGSLLDLSV